MKIIWVNPNEPAPVKPKPCCDVCGDAIYEFTDGVSMFSIPIGSDFRGYEYSFYMCSDECYKKATEENLPQKKAAHLIHHL